MEAAMMNVCHFCNRIVGDMKVKVIWGFPTTENEISHKMWEERQEN